MQNRCWGCMSLVKTEYEVCPHCGYVMSSKAVEAIHLNPGTVIHNRFITGKVIGYGGFGVTYLAWDGMLQQKVAIKEYMPSEFSTRMPGNSQITVFIGEKAEQFNDGKRKFIEEARKLAKFQNEDGIVNIIDSFEENNTAYLVMEYLDGETLAEYLKEVGTIQEDDAIDMLRPIMESLKRVHEIGILHRDIAPDNIFITKDGRIKLIDFGASRYATTTHSRSLTVIVKPGFSPEEQYRSRGDQGAYTDVYSIAATLYKMITGKTPPDAMERRAKYENQNRDILVCPHRIVQRKISPAHEIAILNALNVQIEDRTPDIDTFIRELDADPPAKRIYGKIKKIDFYTMPMWFKIAVPSAVALMGALVILMAAGIIRFSLFSEKIIVPEGIVTVPEVEEMGKIEATAMLEETGLIVYYGPAVYTDYVEDSLVVTQQPFGGYYIERGGTITICVAYGKVVEADFDTGVSTVPYVCDMTLEEALARLEQAGLGTPVIEYISDDYVAAGNVCSQSVDNGDFVAIGTVITLYVSTGPAEFDMPDVYNMTIDEAISLLEKHGLRVNISYVNAPGIAVGNVASQSIASGSPAKKGQTVTIEVSNKAPTITVPNVLGMAEKDAINALKEVGFTVNVLDNYDTVVPAGAIISQNPSAGTEQEQDTTVTIFVSKGKQPVTVNFDGNGGKAGKASITAYYSDSIGELPTATRRGYDFDGWYTSSNGGTRVDSSYVINSTASFTLYAGWSGGLYTLSFDAVGGTVSVSSVTLNVDSPYGTLPTPTRAGYSFEGWYTSPDGGSMVDSSTLMGDTSTVIYAHWKEIYYTLTFNPNGGTVDVPSASMRLAQPYGTLPTPTRDHYNFDGWFTAADGGSQVSSTTIMGIGDATIYAHWTIKSYTLKFDANGGSVGESARTINYGAGYGTLPTPSKDYCDFAGWYAGSNPVSASTTMGDSDVTITAHWTDKAYSGWTLASNVPAGARTIDEKWEYDKVYRQTGTSSTAPAGWGVESWVWSDWGGFSAWSTTPVTASESVDVETKVDRVLTGYTLTSYMYVKGSTIYYTASQMSNFMGKGYSQEFHLTKTVDLIQMSKMKEIGGNATIRANGMMYQNGTGGTVFLDTDGTTMYCFRTEIRTNTTSYRYRTRDRIYTYSQTRHEESGTAVSGGGDISNVQHYVIYQPK